MTFEGVEVPDGAGRLNGREQVEPVDRDGVPGGFGTPPRVAGGPAGGGDGGPGQRLGRAVVEQAAEPCAGAVGPTDELQVAIEVAVERSITRSMKPYSRASSAVNQRSRSESASMRSTGWPVWWAMRSAIIRLR